MEPEVRQRGRQENERDREGERVIQTETFIE